MLLLGFSSLVDANEELPLTQEGRAAGITWQGLVKLGTKWKNDPIRIVKVEVDGKTILLATDLKMEAELIALIYRYRWQIELFFKWMKCILKSRHLLAESERGVAIQIYTILIAALMLQIYTGKRPSKRQIEMIQFYLTGFIGLEELTTMLGLEKKQEVRTQGPLSADKLDQHRCGQIEGMGIREKRADLQQVSDPSRINISRPISKWYSDHY